jgi:hypothetical protein
MSFPVRRFNSEGHSQAGDFAVAGCEVAWGLISGQIDCVGSVS